jgi:hypothetical protein
MGRKKKITIGQENGHTVISGTAEDLTQTFKDATERIKNKNAIDVRSARLRDQLFCDYKYLFEASGATNKASITSEVPVHEDLVTAYKKLNPHLAVICEEVSPNEIVDIDDIGEYDDKIHEEGSLEHKMSHFVVTGFRLEGEGEREGVVLIGEKRLSTGEWLKLETPKVGWSDDYACVNELRVSIGDVIAEVEEYKDGKRAPEVQQSLFDEEENYAEEGL